MAGNWGRCYLCACFDWPNFESFRGCLVIYGLPKLMGVHPRLWGAVGYLGYKSRYDWKVVSGTRDSAEQAANYAIGRTVQLDRAPITDAPPGTSAHEYGLAVDIQPTLDKGVTVVQDTEHPAWKEKSEILASFSGVKEISISSGADRPHIEVRDWQTLKNWKAEYTGFAVILGVIGISALFLR